MRAPLQHPVALITVGVNRHELSEHFLGAYPGLAQQGDGNKDVVPPQS